MALGAQIGALGIRIPVAHTFTALPALAKSLCCFAKLELAKRHEIPASSFVTKGRNQCAGPAAAQSVAFIAMGY